MAKNKNSFVKISLISGVLLMALSLIIYNFWNIGFYKEIHSEIFGVGAALFVVGLAYWIYKIKLG